ncbi:LysR family transcriptional regulator [Piscinibacter gummiphilus]|uniref:LysR family transcriptional regulator n=1 Tax=Piscinibacter gummiphilus TaxID=946333 RepID=UPI000A26EA12|nr:LysR family transcriptional regulator [Piscinibacter gummiphilus]ATU64253.1 LysR family transcriptional regulator [Piscinibacter gummiphilus]GLS93452.1 LysR family transcriptional regulator [Piscinibacter gummiphilus]
MRNFTLRSLRIFEAVASACSFSRGSELVGITQSAASQQIRTLEEELGTRLFDTVGRPIQLTPAGRALLGHARLILAQINVASDALASLEGEFRGQLHIGVVSPAYYFVPRLIKAFRARYAEVRVKLSLGKRDALLQKLAGHEIDLMIGGFPSAETEVEAETFARNPHCLIAPVTHRLARRDDLFWQDLRDETMIFREAGSTTRNFYEHLLQTQGIDVKARLEFEGNETVKQAVMAGLGISFLSAHAFQLELEAGKLAVLKVGGTPKWLDWCVLSRRNEAAPAIRQAFKDFLMSEGLAYAACQFQSPETTPRRLEPVAQSAQGTKRVEAPLTRSPVAA